MKKMNLKAKFIRCNSKNRYALRSHGPRNMGKSRKQVLNNLIEERFPNSIEDAEWRKVMLVQRCSHFMRNVFHPSLIYLQVLRL